MNVPLFSDERLHISLLGLLLEVFVFEVCLQQTWIFFMMSFRHAFFIAFLSTLWGCPDLLQG